MDNFEFLKKSNFWPKMTILTKNDDFGQKCPFLAKIGKIYQPKAILLSRLPIANPNSYKFYKFISKNITIGGNF